MSTVERFADLLALDGKVALVTGGAGGIGRAIVTVLLDAGAAVASIDRPATGCPEGAFAIEGDLGDTGDTADLVARFRERFDRLDLFVHCAGITRDAVLWKMEPDDWDRVLEVNLSSAFRLLRETTPLLRESGDGAVVLISSINGERGKFGQANYAASKAGLIAFGRTAARELGRFGVRANMVAPGWIDTPLNAMLPEKYRQQALEETALGRAGRPEDVAATVLFLCSPMARHITGQVLRVDGGQLMA